MKTRCLYAMIGMALLTYLPLHAADDAFQIEAIPFSNPVEPDTSTPAVQMVSATIAAASSVTANPCIGGTRGCPDPTAGYASIPFPAAVLPAGGDAVVTWMFQDVSYSGPVQMTVAFVQNGVTVGAPSSTHSSRTLAAGEAYLAYFATAVPVQAAAGSATVVVDVSYGGTIARASQEFTVSVAGSDGPAPGIQVLSVTVAALSSVTVEPCVSGELGCPDPTQGYASIPFPAAVLPLDSETCVSLMVRDLSYAGPVEIAVALVQNGAVVGMSYPIGGGLSDEPSTQNLLIGSELIPFAAVAGPARVVVSISYGGATARASQAVNLQ